MKRDEDFINELVRICGENINACFQCGNCSGGCPMVKHMDISPRLIIHLAQLGQKERLRGIKAYWVCSSCYFCGVICPRGLDVPKVMEALRLLTLRENIDFIVLKPESGRKLPEKYQIAQVAAYRKMTS